MAREVMSAAAMALAAAAALPDVPAAWVARELALGFSLAPPASVAATPTAAMSLPGSNSGHDAGRSGGTPARDECPPFTPGRLAGSERTEDAERAAGISARTGPPCSSPGGASPGAGGVHGVVGVHLAVRGSSLRGELARVGPLGRLAALRGLVVMLPAATLCAPLRWPEADCSCAGDRCSSGEGFRSRVADHGAAARVAQAAAVQRGAPDQGTQESAAWTLLAGGLLPAAAALVEALPDAHFRFHAAQLLLACLQRMEACLMVRTASLRSSSAVWSFILVLLQHVQRAAGDSYKLAEPDSLMSQVPLNRGYLD